MQNYKRISIVKNASVLIAVLLLHLPAYSQQSTEDKPVVAVMDFGIKNIPRAEGEVVVDYLASAIFRTGYFDVIDRSQRQTILAELEFSYGDCTDEACQIEIGRMLSANQIVVGTLGKAGTRYIINI